MTLQDSGIPTKREWPTFEQVYQSILDLMTDVEESRRYPELKLRNRLLNLGLKEFLEPIVEDKKTFSRALEAHGLPFRYLSQWDEAILAMAHYLSRFRVEEGSKLNVYALHRLSKGEDKTLADWQTAKAKLYLELQNIILLLGKIDDQSTKPVTLRRRSQIYRIFAFSKFDDIAFLTQSAVSVLGEQLGTGIKVGFLFTDTFPRLTPVTNNLIIDFHPNRKTQTPHRFNFYAMHEILEEQKENNLPFHERCSVKWFENSRDAFAAHPILKKVFALYPKRNSTWSTNYNDSTVVLGMEKPGGPSQNHVFNTAVVMMAKAFNGTVRENKEAEVKISDFNNRINQTVITSDWIRLQRAISAFDDPASLEILAVDATSVKNSLSLHESDPTYRHWLRRSLSRVILSPKKSLKRIYILDDNSPQKAVKEFATLKREMQYYLDYFHFDISELSKFLDPLDELKDPKNAPSSLFQPKIEVYITTAKILTEIAMPWVNRKVLKSIVVQTAESETITKVDFICSSTGQKNGGMIYNFLNRRADPGELVFLAYLFRDKFNVNREKEILFESLDELRGEPQSKDERFRNSQLQHRKDTLKKSIKRYADESEFPKEIKILASGVDAADTEEKLLQIRADIETALYNHFEGRFSYLFEFLKYASLKVDFFAKDGLPLEKVSLFTECKTARALENRIRDSLTRKKIPWPTYDENKQHEAVVSEPKIKHEEEPAKPKIFFNYATADQARVLKIFNKLSEEGFAAWLDKNNLLPGDHWRREINKAIEASLVFVACFSRNYVLGDGFRYAELRQAMERAKEMAPGHKFIIPIRLDDGEIPEELLSGLHYIDVFDNRGRWHEDNWKLFSEALRQELNREALS